MLSDFLKPDSLLSSRSDELRECLMDSTAIRQTSPFYSYSFPE